MILARGLSSTTVMGHGRHRRPVRPFHVRLVYTAVPKGTTLGNFEPGAPRTIQIPGVGGLPTSGISAVMLTFMTVKTVTAGQMPLPARMDLRARWTLHTLVDHRDR